VAEVTVLRQSTKNDSKKNVKELERLREKTTQLQTDLKKRDDECARLFF